MELMYIWIEKYGSISQQGFNLSGKLRFNYDQATKELAITENMSYLENFFDDSDAGKAGISNVTAIIGENGSGKSTFLEYIKTNICPGAGGIFHPCIIAFQDGDDRYVYHHESISIKNNNLQKYEYRLKSYKGKKETTSKLNASKFKLSELSELSETSFIFFSNIFDAKRQEEQCGNLYNISTNYLTQADKRNQLELGLCNETASEIGIHRVQEVQRQVRFLFHFHSSNSILPYKLPEEILVTPAYIEEIITEDDDNRLNLGTGTEGNIFEKFIQASRKTLNSHARFRNGFYFAIFFTFLREVTGGSKGQIINRLPKSKLLMSAYKSNENVCGVVRTFIQSVADQEQDNACEYASMSNWCKGIVNLLDYVEQNLDKTTVNDQGIVVPLTPEKDGINFWDLTKYYEKAMRLNPYLTFDWRDLSSGEKALLNIYSRFFSRADSMVSPNQQLKENIVVLIDEGEVYLHPQWQKQMLFGLMKFLTTAYSAKDGLNKRNIQIILTSNSPFIASDLPRSNIIFMKKENHQSVVVDGLFEKRETFASNIHTLLSDSFFMSDGLIGDYAKQKINKLIDFLIEATPEEIRIKKDYVSKSINLIGEPVIKNKLQSMLNGKLALDVLNIDEKINDLQNQINELNRKRNQ